MTGQIGLYRCVLTQSRYKGGAFYLSAIIANGELTAIDGRFVLEDGEDLTPTKNGFRIPVEKIDSLRQAISLDLREVADTVILKNNTLRLHVRYINDKYGEGIDFRKYKTTEKYTGWDRSGIRMKLEDAQKIRKWLDGLDPATVLSNPDLFAGKNYGRKALEKEEGLTNDYFRVNPILKCIVKS